MREKKRKKEKLNCEIQYEELEGGGGEGEGEREKKTLHGQELLVSQNVTRHALKTRKTTARRASGFHFLLMISLSRGSRVDCASGANQFLLGSLCLTHRALSSLALSQVLRGRAHCTASAVDDGIDHYHYARSPKLLRSKARLRSVGCCADDKISARSFHLHTPASLSIS